MYFVKYKIWSNLYFTKYRTKPKVYYGKYTTGWLVFCAAEGAYMWLNAGDEYSD